jgi:chitinase
VTDCPARIGSVTTDTIVLYTTVCPVTATETNGGVPTSTAAASTSPVEYTTSTVYTTTIYTITSCAPTVTNCPAKLGQVTTDIISLYVTVCPVSEAAATASPTASPTAIASAENTYSTTTLSSTTTQFVTVKVIQSTATVAPYPVSVTAQGNAQGKALGTGTGLPVVSLITTTAGAAATPSQFTGAASTSRGPFGVMVAVVLGAVVFMM